MSDSGEGVQLAESMSLPEGLYLLEDIYVRADAEGPFRRYESPEAQMDRLSSLRSDSRLLADSIMAVGHALCADCIRGDLESFHERVSELRSDELLFAAADKAFYTAALSGHLHICEYMRKRGFPVAVGSSRSEQHMMSRGVEAFVNHVLVHTDDDEGDSGDDGVTDGQAARSHRKSADAALQTLLLNLCDSSDKPMQAVSRALANNLTAQFSAMSTRDLVVCASNPGRVSTSDDSEPLATFPAAICTSLVYYLSMVDGVGVNYQRPSDGYTPLHLACCACRVDVVVALLCCGADPNAVANDESTPLAAAQACLADARGDDAAARAASAVVSLLLQCGARCTWLEAMRAPPTASGKRWITVTETSTSTATGSSGAYNRMHHSGVGESKAAALSVSLSAGAAVTVHSKPPPATGSSVFGPLVSMAGTVTTSGVTFVHSVHGNADSTKVANAAHAPVPLLSAKCVGTGSSTLGLSLASLDIDVGGTEITAAPVISAGDGLVTFAGTVDGGVIVSALPTATATFAGHASLSLLPQAPTSAKLRVNQGATISSMGAL